MLNDQALFDAKVAELERQRINLDPEPAVDEEPESEPEPEVCPDFMYNISQTGDCQREQLTKLCLRCDRFPREYLKPVDDRCPRFIENYGGTTYGSCYEADKPYCPNCTQYPREKWLLGKNACEWHESEQLDFLETFNIHIKHGTASYEIQDAVDRIIKVITTVAQIAAAKKNVP